jgi:hypothetical protein
LKQQKLTTQPQGDDAQTQLFTFRPPAQRNRDLTYGNFPSYYVSARKKKVKIYKCNYTDKK